MIWQEKKKDKGGTLPRKYVFLIELFQKKGRIIEPEQNLRMRQICPAYFPYRLGKRVWNPKGPV